MPVFIGGAPRTGTTLLSALVSTSEKCNPFSPEYHCLGTIGQALPQLSLPSQNAFFRSKDTVLEACFQLVRRLLDEAWLCAGRPDYLVIKQCKLTPVFGMLARFLPNAKFLIIMRDARQAIESMLRAIEKHRNGTVPAYELTRLITQFNIYYKAVIREAPYDLKGRLLFVDFAQLAQGDTFSIGKFLKIYDIDLHRLWRRSTFDILDYSRDPMFSDLWGKPMSPEAGTRELSLDEATCDRIARETLDVSQCFKACLAERSWEAAEIVAAAG